MIANSKIVKKSKDIAKAKPFPSVNPPQPIAANTRQQKTPNITEVSQSFTGKRIVNIRNEHLQKQCEQQPVKQHSRFHLFRMNSVSKRTISLIVVPQNDPKSDVSFCSPFLFDRMNKMYSEG